MSRCSMLVPPNISELLDVHNRAYVQFEVCAQFFQGSDWFKNNSNNSIKAGTNPFNNVILSRRGHKSSLWAICWPLMTYAHIRI